MFLKILLKQGPNNLRKVDREKIEFYTTGIGQPHVIKIAIFPNWKVYHTEGPVFVSP